MLPSTDVLLEAARRGDWRSVLGLRPGDKLTQKQERSLRAQVHPDRGHPHEVAAAVAQALESLRTGSTVVLPPVDSELDRLIEECSLAVRCEPLNAIGRQAVRKVLDELALARTVASIPRLRYFYSGWGQQADQRCYKEIRRIWQAYEQRIHSDPVRAHEIGCEFLAEAAQIDAFQDNFTEAPHRIWYAESWVHHAEQVAERTPAAARHRKTMAQRKRRAEQRLNEASLSEADATALVFEHCELVAEGRLATPLGQLRRSLLKHGLDKKVLLAAGISTKGRRQHRPLQGNSFYYATMMADGKRMPIRLRNDA